MDLKIKAYREVHRTVSVPACGWRGERARSISAVVPVAALHVRGVW
jgi:hypothetical protein